MLSESNRKALDEAKRILEQTLLTMQQEKGHGEVVLTLNMVSGGVSGAFCTKTATTKVK